MKDALDNNRIYLGPTVMSKMVCEQAVDVWRCLNNKLLPSATVRLPMKKCGRHCEFLQVIVTLSKQHASEWELTSLVRSFASHWH